MGLSNEELSEVLSEAAEVAGCALYDFERIAGGSGMLRVYLYNPTLMDEPGNQSAEQVKRISVTHDECVQVSRWITAHPRVEELLPGTTVLEVSSPGINRKLKKVFHYELSVGERVKVRFATAEAGSNKRTRRSVTGKLTNANSNSITILVPGVKNAPDEKIVVPYVDIDGAQVDFEF